MPIKTPKIVTASNLIRQSIQCLAVTTMCRHLTLLLRPLRKMRQKRSYTIQQMALATALSNSVEQTQI